MWTDDPRNGDDCVACGPAGEDAGLVDGCGACEFADEGWTGECGVVEERAKRGADVDGRDARGGDADGGRDGWGDGAEGVDVAERAENVETGEGAGGTVGLATGDAEGGAV